MISAFIAYVADLLFYFFAIGVGLHLFDRYFGTAIYRWWYDRSRESPLPQELDVGFMYNRPFSRKHKYALVLSGAQSLYMLWEKGISIITELIAFPLEAWALLLGFAAGKYVYGFMRGEDAIVEKMRQVNISNLYERVRGFAAGIFSGRFRSATQAVQPQRAGQETVEKTVSEPATPHWRERLRSYTNNR